MIKALAAAAIMASAGLVTGAEAQTTITTTVSAINCKLDPAEAPPATPSVAAGVAAGNKFGQAFYNFSMMAQKGDVEAERRLGNRIRSGRGSVAFAPRRTGLR